MQSYYIHSHDNYNFCFCILDACFHLVEGTDFLVQLDSGPFPGGVCMYLILFSKYGPVDEGRVFRLLRFRSFLTEIQ